VKKLLAGAALAAAFLCMPLVGCREEIAKPPISGGETEATSPEDNREIADMYVTISGNKLKVTLEKNSSVEALIAELEKGDIAYMADDYGGFEKVGNIGVTLPKNDTRITTQAGDVILYQGNNICLYYGTNTWSFTRIGRIEGYEEKELKTLLGAGKGEVQITLSLTKAF